MQAFVLSLARTTLALLCFVSCTPRPTPASLSSVRSLRSSEVRTDTNTPDATADECDASAYPALTDYSEITAGRRFSLVLQRASNGAWLPVRALRMPMHHASTIVFEPTLDTLIPDAGAAQSWLVFATGIGRQAIEHDARRHTWFATYAAHPDRVCPLNE